MSVTVDFLFKASKDGSFNSVINQVTGGIGKLSKEAEESSQKIVDLLNKGYDNPKLAHVFTDLTKAFLTKDIDKINDALVKTEANLTKISGKIGKDAFKKMLQLDGKDIEKVLTSALKDGTKKGTISNMIKDRLYASGSKEFFKDYIVSAEEASKQVTKILKQENDAFTRGSVSGIRDFVGYYQRLVELGAEIPVDAQEKMQEFMKSFEGSKYIHNGKTLFDKSEISGMQEAVRQLSEEEGKIIDSIANATHAQVDSQKQVTEEAKKTKEAKKEEKEATEQAKDATEKQAESQKKVTEKAKETTEAAKEEANSKKDTAEATEKQAEKQEEATEKEKESAKAAKEEKEAKKEVAEKTKEQAQEQEKATEKTKESVESAKQEKEAKQETKEATKEQAIEQQKASEESKKSAENAKEEAKAQAEAAEQAERKAEAEKKSEESSKKRIKLTKEQKQNFQSDIEKMESAIADANVTIEKIEETLSESNLRKPSNLNEARNELIGRRNALDNYLKRRSDIDKRYPEYGARKIYSYYRQLENARDLDRKNQAAIDAKMGNALIPEFADGKIAKNAEKQLNTILERRKQLIEKYEGEIAKRQKLLGIEPEKTENVKEDTNATNALSDAHKKEAETAQQAANAEKALGDTIKKTAKEKEKKAAEERAEKKTEEKMRLIEAKKDSKENAKQKTLDNYTKWTGVKTGSATKAIQENKQLAEKQKEVASTAGEVAEAENSAAKATANLTAEQEAQIKTLEEQKQRELDVISVQEAWQKRIQPVLDDEKYKTKGKKEASDKLRSATRHLGDVRTHPSEYKGFAYEKELSSIKWWKSWLEAQRQGISPRTLSQNRTDLDNGSEATRYIEQMQEELNLHLGILAKAKENIAQIEQQIQDVMSGKLIEAPVDTSVVETKTNEITDAIAEKIKSIEEIEQAYASALEFMIQNSDFSSNNNVRIGQRNSEWMDSQVRHALNLANADTINGVSSVDNMKYHMLATEMQRFSEAINDALDRQMAEAVENYISNVETIGVKKVAALPMNADKEVQSAMEEANKSTMDAMVEEQVKQFEKITDSLSKKATTYAANTSKTTRTPNQNQQVSDFDAKMKEATEIYDKLIKDQELSNEVIQRLEEAKKRLADAISKGYEYVNKSQAEKDMQQAEKDAEKAAQQAEKDAEREATKAENAERTRNKSRVNSISKVIDRARNVEAELDSKIGNVVQNEAGEKLVANYNRLKEIINSIKSPDLINTQDTQEVDTMVNKAEELKRVLAEIKVNSQDAFGIAGSEKVSDLQAKISKLMDNGNLSNEQFLKLDQYKQALASPDIDTKGYQDIYKGFSQINGEVNKGSTLIDTIQGKFKNLAGYIVSFMSFYTAIRYAKQIASTVRDFDDAFTEMRKVSDESVETLKAYQKESYDLAASVGTDALSLQQSTADFLRLGQSLEEAKDSAVSANILMNVSEFSSIDEATESLISMKSAFSDLSNMDIIDRLNKIGNDFSISTDGIATALQDSAAALKVAGKSLPVNMVTYL